MTAGRLSGLTGFTLVWAGQVVSMLGTGMTRFALALIGIGGVMTVDVVTFVAAIGALLVVRIPPPATTEAGRQGRGSLLREALCGFRYIFARPSLLGLQLLFFSSNFLATFGWVVLAPMVLARTQDNAAVLGMVQSVGAAGGVLGGLALAAWGGPRRKVHGVLLGFIVNELLGWLPVGLARSPAVWAGGMLLSGATIPIVNGSNQAIWQAKVAPDVQGRVFAARRLIAQITGPVGMLIAGPLADRVMEPAMAPGGWLAPVLGGVVGTGPGGPALAVALSSLPTPSSPVCRHWTGPGELRYNGCRILANSAVCGARREGASRGEASARPDPGHDRLRDRGGRRRLGGRSARHR